MLWWCDVHRCSGGRGGGVMFGVVGRGRGGVIFGVVGVVVV